MKKWLLNICIVLLLAGGTVFLLYPTISDEWNKFHQNQMIAEYDEKTQQMNEKDYAKAWEEAKAYNADITQNVFQSDIFQEDETQSKDDGYRSVLNINGDGIMGYVSIPKIHQKIPVYHGTSEAVLQIAAGHIKGTKLPIGGENNHSVIAAHRGLPNVKLFSDLDQMQEGDKFYLHVLGQVLAYEVDQILPMIDKEDYGSLTKAMAIEEGADQVTLFTCTPYGVNSHRMLVRGARVPYHGEDDETDTPVASMVRAVNDYYMLLIIVVIAIIAFVGMIVKIAGRRRRKI